MNVNESMMTAKPITPLLNGGFDDCAVSGQRYEDRDGNRFWDVTIVSAANYRPALKRINARCIISNDNFECATVDIPPPSFEVRKGNAVNIDPDVQEGVLGVIRKWENETT